jgi:hypothetical protein
MYARTHFLSQPAKQGIYFSLIVSIGMILATATRFYVVFALAIHLLQVQRHEACGAWQPQAVADCCAHVQEHSRQHLDSWLAA